MKLSYLAILIILLLTACGPSAEQMTATAIMAQAQTQTAAPTHTLTSTTTPTATSLPTATLTPTITPIPRVRANTGDVVSHEPTGTPPIGMPEEGTSTYFESNILFNIDINTRGVKYMLFLDKKQELPQDAVLEVHFQNPSDPSTALVVVVTDLSKDSIIVESKSIPMSKFECGNYWIDVHVYPDASAVNEISSHTQWANSAFC